MKIIPNLEDVSAEWLTSIINSSGIDGKIIDFTTETIGTGQIGKCVRFNLVYEKEVKSGPKTLIGKFPSENPDSRRTGVELEQYLREILFYRDLKSNLSIATPDCFYADILENNENFALILEDMSPARQGDQTAGSSFELVKTAVSELIGLHGPTWCNSNFFL